MPQYRFHVAVSGIMSAPSTDYALAMIAEFVQSGKPLPAAIEYLDSEVHAAERATYIQGLDDHSDQFSLFTQPELVQ